MKQLQTYIDALLKFLNDRMPRKVAISAMVLAVTAVLFIILLPTLGGAHTDAIANNESLKASVQSTTAKLRTAGDDHQYAVDNLKKYEDLIHSDRLVPHTRRVAMTQMQKLAVDRGLSALSYNFTAAGDRAAAAAASQPTSGGYKVQVEKVDLKVGSALDTQLFDFVIDLGEAFPGAAVVEQVTLERAPDITPDALNKVSTGEDSGLVKGDVVFTWRTAQKLESPDAKKGQGR